VPPFEATEALAVAWSEASLQYLHQLSCEDPLTGLASLAHVRTRLSEIYREADKTGLSPQSTYSLVVVELPAPAPSFLSEHQFTRVLRLVELADGIRTVFSGEETIGRLGLHRAVAVVRRNVSLGSSVALLGEFVRDLDSGGAPSRVWIEGLPASDDAAAQLLDELAR